VGQHIHNKTIVDAGLVHKLIYSLKQYSAKKLSIMLLVKNKKLITVTIQK